MTFQVAQMATAGDTFGVDSSARLPFSMRLLNTVGRLTPADRIDRFRLDKATVMAEAISVSGLSDFGDPYFEEGLDALLSSIASDIEPHLVGQIALRQTIVDALVNRLRLAQERRMRPEVFETPLRPPIIVTGLHRSGTTHLHRLLAQDQASHAPPYWQLVSPIVPLGAKDTRREQARRSLTLRRRLMPDLARMHTIDADAPEECFYLTASSFESVFFWSMAPVVGYLRWYLGGDRRQKYCEYRLWLQILQQQSPHKRLVLKAPEHLGGVDALFAAVPEAQVVQIRRDPVTSFASYVSMAKTTQALTVPDFAEDRTAQASLDLFESDLARNQAARATHPERIRDLNYDDLVKDPIATITGLYADLEIAVSPEFRAGLTAYLKSHPAGRHGRHLYALADSQIDRGRIERRLAS